MVMHTKLVEKNYENNLCMLENSSEKFFILWKWLFSTITNAISPNFISFDWAESN